MSIFKEQWILYAVLSAVFAALTSIFAKIGISGIDSNLATAIRTCVVLVLAWAIVIYTGKADGVAAISGKGWVFLVLSGAATGASWLFYYKALQMGPASKVAPIDKFSVVITVIMAFVFLGEKPDIKTVAGAALIAAGTLVLAI